VIGAGIFSIFKWGYYYSIDFVGGTNLEYQLEKNVDSSKIKDILKKNKVEVVYLEVKGKNIFLRVKSLDQNQEKNLKNNLEKNLLSKITMVSWTEKDIVVKTAVTNIVSTSALKK